MELIIIIGGSAIILLLAIFFFQLHARIKGAPLVPSHEKSIHKAGQLLHLTGSDLVYDLGCGDGRTLFTFEKVFGCRGIGVDQSLLLICWNKIQSYLKKSTVQFIHQDLRTWTPKETGKYYIFMMPKLFPHLDHIFSSLPKGTLVLCNTFPLSRQDFTLLEKVEDDGFQKGEWLYLFEKN